MLFQCATFRGLCRVPSVYLCRCVDGGQATWLVTNENAHTGQSPFSLSPLCFAANNTQESRLVVQNFNPLFGALGKRQKKTRTIGRSWRGVWKITSARRRFVPHGLGLNMCGWLPTGYASLVLLAPRNLLTRENSQWAPTTTLYFRA